MIIGLEEYIAVNFLLTAAVLILASRHIGSVRIRRIIASSAVSACAAAVFQVKRFPAMTALPVMLLTVGSAFDPRPVSLRLRGVTRWAFWMMTLAGGALLLRQQKSFESMWQAVLCVAPLFLAGLYLTRRGRLSQAASQVRLRIGTPMGSTEVSALIDTGNQLREPFSGLPVLIVSAARLGKILDPACLRNGGELPPGFRLACYHALGGGGQLRCFRPSSLSCLRGGRWLKSPEMWVALYPGRLPGGMEALAPACCAGAAEDGNGRGR